VPQPYLLAITLSLGSALAPALWTRAWAERARAWSFVSGELLALTAIVTLFTLRPRRRALPREITGPVEIKPK
jgi:hypothetical protein